MQEPIKIDGVIKPETRSEFWNRMRYEYPKKVTWGIRLFLWVALPALWYFYDPFTAGILGIVVTCYFCSLDD